MDRRVNDRNQRPGIFNGHRGDTSKTFVHGNITITKKNILLHQQMLTEMNRPLATPDEIVSAFVGAPQQRHFDRAVRLMDKPTKVEQQAS